MNRKQFVILLVVVVVLGAWGLHRWRKQSSSWSGGGTAVGQKLLGDFPINDVAQISIKQGTNELTLVKENDLWRVRERGNYPANFAEISSVLLKLKDLKVIQTETVGPSQLPRLELAAGGANAPTTVEFRDAGGKVIKSLVLGKKHVQKGGQRSPMMEEGGEGGWPDGRYVLAGGAADQVALVSEPLANLEPAAAPWLNKDFFKIEKAKAIAVSFPNATNSWHLVRETEGAELKFAGPKAGEELDSNEAASAANPFSSPSLTDVIVGAAPEQTGLDKPTVIAIETFEGFTYTIKVGAKTNDNYYFTVSSTAKFPTERVAGPDEKPEDKAKFEKEFADRQKQLQEKLAAEKNFAPWTYLVTSWTVEPVLKERSKLLVKKKVDEPNPPTSDHGTPVGESPDAK
jgi:hypothetical protein